MANMTLGLMITKHANLEHIAVVTRAARKAGHPVAILLTDEEVRFANDPKFLELLTCEGVEISLCDHSCERIGMHEKSEGITFGSQFNSAGMLHDSDRILVS